MDSIKCFLCSELFVMKRQTFENDKQKINEHFKQKHFLRISERYESIVCGSENCDKQFVHFSTYYSHIFAKHLSFLADDTKNLYFERIDFGGKFAKMIAEVRLSNLSSSASDINRFSIAANDLLLSCMEDVDKVVKKFLMKKDIDLDADDTRQFLSLFSVENNLKIYQTVDGQVKSLKRQCAYVDPVTCQLDKVLKVKTDVTTNEVKTTEDFKTFQYIPIIETLKLVLSNKEVMYYVQNEKDANILKLTINAFAVTGRANPLKIMNFCKNFLKQFVFNSILTNFYLTIHLVPKRMVTKLLLFTVVSKICPTI